MSFATGANAHPCCRRSANSKGARAARDIAANRRQSFARTRPRSDEEEDDEEESVEEDDEDLDSDDLDGETAAERAARKKKEARRDRTRGTSGGNLSKVVVRGQVLGGSDDGRKRLALEAVERRAAMEIKKVITIHDTDSEGSNAEDDRGVGSIASVSKHQPAVNSQVKGKGRARNQDLDENEEEEVDELDDDSEEEQASVRRPEASTSFKRSASKAKSAPKSSRKGPAKSTPLFTDDLSSLSSSSLSSDSPAPRSKPPSQSLPQSQSKSKYITTTVIENGKRYLQTSLAPLSPSPSLPSSFYRSRHPDDDADDSLEFALPGSSDDDGEEFKEKMKVMDRLVRGSKKRRRMVREERPVGYSNKKRN